MPGIWPPGCGACADANVPTNAQRRRSNNRVVMMAKILPLGEYRGHVAAIGAPRRDQRRNDAYSKRRSEEPPLVRAPRPTGHRGLLCLPQRRAEQLGKHMAERD